MATRYWRGGNGLWNTGTTANWSATSGGATGASPPTIADDVIFNSTNVTPGAVVTIGGGSCKTVTFTGATVTIAVGSSTLTVAGSIISNTTNVSFTYTTGRILITSSTVATITMANIIMPEMSFNGTGGVTLGANLTIDPALTCTYQQGPLSLNSFTFSCGHLSSTSTTARTMAFGTGKLILTGPSGAVISASTAITCTGSRRIEVTNPSATDRTINTATVTGFATCDLFVTTGSDTITWTGGSGITNADFTGFSGTLVLTSTVQVSGNMIFSTGLTVGSSTGGINLIGTGTQTFDYKGKTLNCADIRKTGTGTWTLTEALTAANTSAISHLQGTFNINGFTITVGSFTSGGTLTRAMNFGTTGTIIATNTAATLAFSGTGLTVTGTPNGVLADVAGTNRTIGGPTVAPYINATIYGSGTIVPPAWAGNLNFTTASVSVNGLNYTGGRVAGDLTLSPNMVFSGTVTPINIVFNGSGTQNIRTNGLVTYLWPQFNGTGTVVLQDAWTNSIGNSTTLCWYFSGGSATFDSNGFSVTTNFFTGGSTATVYMRSSIWTFIGATSSSQGTGWNPPGTLYKGTATINFAFVGGSSGERTFSLGGLAYPTMNFVSGSTIVFSGTGSFDNFTNTRVAPFSIKFANGSSYSFANFQLAGVDATTRVTLISSGVTGTTYSFTKTGGGTIRAPFVVASGAIASPGSTWYIPGGGQNNGASGWIVGEPPSTGNPVRDASFFFF